MILCEQCGNEFYKGKIVKKDDKEYLSCPYCHYLNEKPRKSGKKKYHNNNRRKDNRNDH